MIYHLLASSGSLCTTSTSLPNTSLVTTCPILLLQPNRNFSETQVDSMGFHQLSNLNQGHFAPHFPIKLTDPPLGPGPHSRESSASQVSIPSNGSHERSGRRTPHLDASRSVFAPQGRMNLEAGLRADSWNPKRNDWMLHCCTVFLLQGQRLHCHIFRAQGALKRRERCVKVDDLYGKGFTVLDL